MRPEDLFPMMNRRDFLKASTTGLAGAILLGTTSGRVLARERTSLKAEFRFAAARYRVPVELLLAMGYVNTLWEMPPPDASPYEKGDLHGRGTYGIMQLAQNPDMNTLGKASRLTGLSKKELKNDRKANIRGGAAVLSYIQGAKKPSDLNAWYETVAKYGGGALYAHDVFGTLESGASGTISTGESLRLAPQDVEVPQTYTAQAAPDYPRAIWRPAYSGNYTNAHRERSHPIDKIVVHVVQGSYSGAISWFQDHRSNVSAHYVVSRRGRVAQCVRHEDIAWHAGHWKTNTRSIGIEHEGYINNPRWFTDKMYHASARLAAYACRRHRIPIDRRHIIGHNQVPGCPGAGGGISCHTDPGRHWNWQKYMRLIRHYR